MSIISKVIGEKDYFLFCNTSKLRSSQTSISVTNHNLESGYIYNIDRELLDTLIPLPSTSYSKDFKGAVITTEGNRLVCKSDSFYIYS